MCFASSFWLHPKTHSEYIQVIFCNEACGLALHCLMQGHKKKLLEDPERTQHKLSDTFILHGGYERFH